MWNLLKKNDVCRKAQDHLEEIAGRGANVIVGPELMDELSADERTHAGACQHCSEVAEDLVATRRLFREVLSTAQTDRPSFVAKVMAAIVAREKELTTLVSPWSEVPRFASRLAWVAALLLLAGTTWFFERGITVSSHSPSGMAGPESIFEPTPSANQDDVLIGMVEAQP